eukprot:982795_1
MQLDMTSQVDIAINRAFAYEHLRLITTAKHSKYGSLSSPSDYDMLMEADDSVLTCEDHRLVYKQWQMDRDDALLVHGYFRQNNIGCNDSNPLPKDIQRIIASYHVKSYTPFVLLETIGLLEIEGMNNDRQSNKIAKYKNICKNVLQMSILVFLIAFIFVPDIWVLIFIFTYHSNDLSLDIKRKASTFLLYGCIVHFLALFCLCGNRFIGRVLYLFMFIWCIIGVKLHSESEMNKSSACDKRYADTVINWAVLKLTECFVKVMWSLYYWRMRNVYQSSDYLVKLTHAHGILEALLVL